MSREVIDDEPPADLDGDGRDQHDLRHDLRRDVPDAYVPPPAVYAQDRSLVADVTPSPAPAATRPSWAPATPSRGLAGREVEARDRQARDLEAPDLEADISAVDDVHLGEPGGTGPSPTPGTAGGRGLANGPANGMANGAANGMANGMANGAANGLTIRGRRVSPLAATMMVALLALALGAYAGATTADQNARRAAVARTHLVLWASMGDEIRPPVDGMMQLPTKILSIGGPVLLHGVRTRFGTATLQADQPLDSTARVVYLPVKVDCSLAGRWRSDPRSVDYTGTAVVRDEAGSPTREVPVDLTGEFVVAILFSACEQARDPVASSDTAASSDGTSADGTSPDGGVPGAVVTFTQMLSDDRGGLQYTAELDAGSPIAVQVDTPVLALIAGTGPGKFRESTTPPLPHTLKPGQKVTVQVQLTYVCTNGKQVLPWTTTIVEPVLTSTTGSAGYRGWDASLVGVAVRGAIAQAGCSPPDDGESLIVQ